MITKSWDFWSKEIEENREKEGDQRSEVAHLAQKSSLYMVSVQECVLNG